MTTINIARDFSRYPGGRYTRNGKHSGQEFREQQLLPAIRRGRVTVELDGVRGYGSNFLEEVFGGLVRDMGWRARRQVDERLELVASSQSVLFEVNQYIDNQLWARPAAADC